MNSLTLLYAEDDDETRENYTFILQPYFKEIYQAKDGVEGLRLYANKKPDILLIDISMPGLNGLDMVEKIRLTDKTTPVIMLTAHSKREMLLQAVNLKLEAYLIKPIDDDLLKKTIHSLIDQLEQKEKIAINENLVWNKDTHDLLYQNISLKLTKKERLLMHILMSRIGNYVSKDTLIIRIWADEVPDVSHDNKLIQLIFRFNKKIAQYTECATPLIENSYALGYRIKPFK